MPRECSCGSGEFPEAVYDARNIFVAYVCDKCREKRLSVYREDIFTDPDYWTDEPVDDADSFDYGDEPVDYGDW